MKPSLSQRVLIVDDSPTDLRLLERLLAKPDREIATAMNGSEAVEDIRAHGAALVILDVQLPDMDGFEVAEAIRAIDSRHGIPIIFVTATSTTDINIFQGYESGAVDYLIKPVDAHLLRSKVNVFCDLHRQTDLIERQLNEIREKNDALQHQLNEIRTLRGMVPICSSCKRVRDDSGFWEAIETYFHNYSGTEFSHAVCPECADRLYPDLATQPNSGATE